eukprot:TRINITY_DN2304_c0_g1_i7.p1 TRINITY_DN2304_c0_g1~~TRINITY_DN2304_c0_g1_i7.p1  ORF type:complete len:579 (+),score=114.98 TRINITY_DN2304_c0_g1_i7:230-1738(+)
MTVGAGVNEFDLEVPGRIYFGLFCYTPAGCSIDLVRNFTSTFVTTGLTSPPITSGKITTKPLTSGRLTTASLSTGRQATTAELTTNVAMTLSTSIGGTEITSEEATSQEGTTDSDITETSSQASSPDESSSPQNGLKIGIAVGVSLAIVLVASIILALLLFKMKKSRKNQDDVTVELHSAPPYGGLQKIDIVEPPSYSGDYLYNTVGFDDPYSKTPTIGGSAVQEPQSTEVLDHSGSVPEGSESWIIKDSDITVEKEIGRGAFGVVWKGTWRATPVAVKRIISEFISPEALLDFQREMKVMMGMKYHVNVLQMYGMCTRPFSIVTEFVETGSLWNYIRRADPPLTEDQRRQIIIGIARGMLHLHFQNIIHRDLACRNVLLNRGFEPKISDFGLSRTTDGSDYGKTKSEVGPIRWMAPECFISQTYSRKSDAWAFGVTLIELYTAKIPFSNMENLQVAALVSRGEMQPPNFQAPDVIQRLVKNCMRFDAKERPTFEEICQMLT